MDPDEKSPSTVGSVVHPGCGPITASLHEDGGAITEIHRTGMWSLILQVIQSCQHGPIDMASKLQPRTGKDQGHLSKTRYVYTTQTPTYISLSILITLRHH